MKDFLGNELNVGDEVVYANMNYRKLGKAIVISFTKFYVNIEYDNTDFSSNRTSKTRQLPEQLVKIK